jgi:CBS domain-containing protein
LSDVDSYDVQGSARTKSASNTTAAIGRLQLRTEKARTLARPDPVTVAPDTSLREALAQMRARGGDAILVAENNRLAGILTERDVLTRVLGAALDDSQPVSELMTKAPHTLSADASVLEAMQAMESGHYRNVPLTEPDGSVVGLLRQQDLIEFIAEAFPEEILNLPPRPHQLMDQPEGA